jgi:hypothetical protein
VSSPREITCFEAVSIIAASDYVECWSRALYNMEYACSDKNTIERLHSGARKMRGVLVTDGTQHGRFGPWVAVIFRP